MDSVRLKHRRAAPEPSGRRALRPAPHAGAGPGLVGVVHAMDRGGLRRLAATARRACASDAGVLALILLLAAAGVGGLFALHPVEPSGDHALPVAGFQAGRGPG